MRRILVLVASMWVSWFDFGLQTTIGTLLLAILDKFSDDRSTAASVQSLFVAINQGLGVCSGVLITKFGIQKTSVIGSILIPLGFFLSFFATSIVTVNLCVGALSASGVSLMFVSSVAMLKHVFKAKELPLVLALHSVSISLAGLTYPFILEYVLESYGLNGTFLILSGYLMNNFAVSVFFTYTISALKKRSIYQARHNIQTAKTHSDDESNNQGQKSVRENSNLQADAFENKKDVCMKMPNNDGHSIAEVERNTGSYSNSFDSKMCLTNSHGYSNGHSSPVKSEILTTEANDTFTGDKRVYSVSSQMTSYSKEDIYIAKSAEKGFRQVDFRAFTNIMQKRSSAISDTIITLLRNRKQQAIKQNQRFKKLHNRISNHISVAYLAVLLGTGLTIASQNGYLSLLTDIFHSKGYMNDQGLMAFLPLNLCGLVARLLPGLGLGLNVRNNVILAFIFSLCGSIGQIIILFSSNYPMIMVGVGMTGIPMGGVISAASILVAKIVGDSQFHVAFGFLLTFVGLLGSFCGPVYGAIRDSSGNYSTVSAIGALAQLFGATLFLCALFDRQTHCKTYRERTLQAFVEQIQALVDNYFVTILYYM